MAPCNLVTASVVQLAKSFSLFSRTIHLARTTSALPISYIIPVKCLTTQVSSPPKRPLNSYLRYYEQQKPFVTRQNPGISATEVVKKIAQQWRMLTPAEKQPFQDASLRAMQQFKVDLQRYQAQLSPAQIQQQAEERSQKLAKRKAIRKKRELTSLGKPKRPRSPFNIFLSEHFEDARGANVQAKMKSAINDWKNLFSHQQQVYKQLAEDDKIRYKNEMKSWENHMIEIGREDLIRENTKLRQKKKKPAAKRASTVKPKTKVVKTTKKKTAKTVTQSKRKS